MARPLSRSINFGQHALIQVPRATQPDAGITHAAVAVVVQALESPGIHIVDCKGQCFPQFLHGFFIQGRVLAICVKPAAFRPLCTACTISVSTGELTVMAALFELLIEAYQASGVSQAGNDPGFFGGQLKPFTGKPKWQNSILTTLP